MLTFKVLPRIYSHKPCDLEKTVSGWPRCFTLGLWNRKPNLTNDVLTVFRHEGEKNDVVYVKME